MKYLILLALAVASFATAAFSQENYTMFENTYMTVKTDKYKEFAEAMSKHNNDFHSGDGPYHANVWMVNTGKYAGSVVWSMGPCTFSHLDARPDSKEHTEDWMYNVMPNIQKSGESGYWKLDDKISYSPEANMFNKLLISVYDIEDWQMYRFKEILGKVAEVYREKKYEHTFNVFLPAFDMAYGRDVAIVWGFDNYAAFDEDNKFKADFEALHGEGSWQKVMNEYQDIVKESVDEIWELNTELSGKR